jgi:argininosuccinate lyase
MTDPNQPRYLDAGGRLAAPPSRQLVRAFAHELEYAQFLFEGISYADIAHVLMLVEQGIAPADEGEALLAALVEMHDRGLDGLTLDAKWGDLYNNRDAELQRRLGDRAGWLHAGRARREALTLAWLIHLRSAGAELLRELLASLRRIVEVSKSHGETLMPDFTYLQHAHPTTLGHYLLGFVYPLLRDGERLLREWHFVDQSPAGSASTNGSRLPLDRERLRQLLGFAELNEHNRDAMWRSDVPINLMAVLVSLTTGASRLAEELQVWCTEEFGFVELADEHCRTSVIMPNKKNPYALTFIRGQARELDGNLVSVITTNQTVSGQIDNRNASYNILPRAIAATRDVVRLLADVLEGASFDVERLRAQANTGFTFATELTDLLLERERVDSRRAHEIVGAVVTELRGGEINAVRLAASLQKAFRDATGAAPGIAVEDVWAELDAERIVRERKGRGSCAPQAMRLMFEQLERHFAAVEKELDETHRQASFPVRIREAVAQRLGRDW